MAPLTQNAGNIASADPNAILNECRDIDRGVDQIERNLEQLRMLQQRTLDDADSSSSSVANRQLDSLSSETMAQYRTLTERVRTVKSNRDARTPKNSPQVGRVDRRLKQAIQEFQQVESQFRKRTQDQMARQYRIVRPDATEQEVRAAVEDTSGGQVFSQALMQSDRQGRARSALTAVQDRHKALVKIEQQMVELAQLFQDMDTLVIQQEAAVTQIEAKGEEVVDNLDKGNEEIGVAVNTARKTRKKKWICLGICGTSTPMTVMEPFANSEQSLLLPSLPSSWPSTSPSSSLRAETTRTTTATTTRTSEASSPGLVRSTPSAPPPFPAGLPNRKWPAWSASVCTCPRSRGKRHASRSSRRRKEHSQRGTAAPFFIRVICIRRESSTI